MPRRRVLSLALSVLAVTAMLCSATLPAASAATPRAATTTTQGVNGLTTAVSGTIDGVTQTGTLTIDRFVRSGSGLSAVGDLLFGGMDFGAVQVPVNLAQTTGTCEILHLDLGPLDLDLLGLHIHLNEVVLDITAEQGPGNLLGNLLCAVAHLLDNTNALSGLAALLNQILAALNL